MLKKLAIGLMGIVLLGAAGVSIVNAGVKTLSDSENEAPMTAEEQIAMLVEEKLEQLKQEQEAELSSQVDLAAEEQPEQITEPLSLSSSENLQDLGVLTIQGVIETAEVPEITVLTTGGEVVPVNTRSETYLTSIWLELMPGDLVTVTGIEDYSGRLIAQTITLDETGQVFTMWENQNAAGVTAFESLMNEQGGQRGGGLNNAGQGKGNRWVQN